jgi:UDP-N-acetylglucosamine 2-epimerase (non-hydrolysing)
VTRVLVAIGTRPEAVKLAPVVRALRARGPAIEAVVCAIAQHREMLDEVLWLFEISPDHDLDVMRDAQDLTSASVRVLERFGALLDEVRPDLVLVQGDTTAAMASSLAAFYRRTAVGHVEAGLRTDDPYAPYPEEMMRRLISRIATLHFAATPAAAERLARELVPLGDIFVTGNPVVDALLWIRDRAPAPEVASGRTLIAVTAHRRESFGAPLGRICDALRQIVERNADVEIVYPVHPNPQVTSVVHARLAGVDRVSLVAPMAYDRFVGLMARSRLFISDSGGVQEEAPVLGRPVLVLRDRTERPEGVAAGATMMVGTDTDRIVRETERLLRDEAHYAAMARPRSPYGDGHAAERIADVIAQRFAGVGDGADRWRYRA